MALLENKFVEGKYTYVEISKSRFLSLPEEIQPMVKKVQKNAGHKNTVFIKYRDNGEIAEIKTRKEVADEIRMLRTATRKVLFEKMEKIPQGSKLHMGWLVKNI
jgi:hypothetical protein